MRPGQDEGVCISIQNIFCMKSLTEGQRSQCSPLKQDWLSCLVDGLYALHAKIFFGPLIQVSSSCVGIVDVFSNFIKNPLSLLFHVSLRVEKTKETKDLSSRPCYYHHIPQKSNNDP